MTPLLFRPAALEDLEAIWLYSAETWGLDQADRYLRDLHARLAGVASGALRAQPADDVKAGYLRLRCAQHVVILRHTDEGFLIVRLLHMSMDHRRHLG